MNLLLVLSFSFLLAPFTHAAKLVQFASGFSKPIAILDDPLDGGTRKFVVEKDGLVKILNAKGKIRKGNFLDLSSIVTKDVNEGGLLGLAFHPDYSTNRFLFVNYTTRINGKLHTVIRRLRCDANNPNRVTVGNTDKETVLKFEQPYDNHNGGQILFSPKDKMLYIAVGDGGSGGDPEDNAQNRKTLLGKILRINVSTSEDQAGYNIPYDNPYVNNTYGRKEEIWHRGLRNPWRFTFDRNSGDMFIGDVGQSNLEEISFARNGRRGKNFGWRRMEGNVCFSPAPPKNCLLTPSNRMKVVKKPILVYSRSGGCSVTGGYRYRGTVIPSLAGKYIYGDFCTGTIWAGTYNRTMNTWSAAVLLDTQSSISSFGEGKDGELYIVDLKGNIYELQDS